MVDLLKEFDDIYNNKISDYEDTKDIIRGYYNNEFSCINGCINELIYYYQTIELYKKYPIAILKFLNDNEFEVTFDESLDVDIQINRIVWLAFEVFVSNKILELEGNGF